MFEDRFDAARQLVQKLQQYKNNPNVIVIAIPRGGLELGSVLAKELQVPLDVIFTKKIGYPGNPEYAIGAVSLTHEIINHDFAEKPEFKNYIAEEIKKVRKLLQERAVIYRGNKPPINLTNKIVIVVDDGVATGSTLMATLLLIKEEKPQKIVVALPVAPKDTLEVLKEYTDEVICLEVPHMFFAVGQVYKKFNQVSDEEAIKLLREVQT